MVIYECKICIYKTLNRYNYNKHLLTKKHLKNQLLGAPKEEKNEEIEEENEENVQIEEENEDKSCISKSKQNQMPMQLFSEKLHLKCHFCQKRFTRNDNLKRHISVCKLSQKEKVHPNAPICTILHPKKNGFQCTFCNQVFSRNFTLNRHYEKCKIRLSGNQELQKDFEIQLLKNDLQNKEKTIEIVSKMAPTQITHNNITNNKTINYLNTHYGDMIEMERFLYNLQHTEQLTHHEREMLLIAYKDNGIDLFARSFSHIMKENCRRQLQKEGLPDRNMLPLCCSDGNFRSHKEKSGKGWETHYDNHSINKMINISSDQVYQSHHHPIFIDGKNRNKVFKQIKQDNHAQELSTPKLVTDNEEIKR